MVTGPSGAAAAQVGGGGRGPAAGRLPAWPFAFSGGRGGGGER